MIFALDDNLEVLGDEEDLVGFNPLLTAIPGLLQGVTGGLTGGQNASKPAAPSDELKRLLVEQEAARARREAERSRKIMYGVLGGLAAVLLGAATYVALKK